MSITQGVKMGLQLNLGQTEELLQGTEQWAKAQCANTEQLADAAQVLQADLNSAVLGCQVEAWPQRSELLKQLHKTMPTKNVTVVQA